jgi:hypothetical protein
MDVDEYEVELTWVSLRRRDGRTPDRRSKEGVTKERSSRTKVFRLLNINEGNVPES